MRYKRVLLISPFYSSSVYRVEPYLNAGLGYVSEALHAAGIKHQVYDMSLQTQSELLYKRIQQFDPDLIGISMCSLNFRNHYALANEIKSMFPHIHIVAGGPHVSTFRKKVLEDCLSIDFGITLEGEQTIVDLCEEVLALSEIQGLIYRNKNQEVIYTGDRPFCKDLDNLPIPTFSGFEPGRYSPVTIPIVSSRGCPFKCIYCPVKVTIGREYRVRNPILVADEIEWWYRRGFQSFDFTDDNFTLLPERVHRFCEEIARRDMKQALFSCGNGIRADRVDRQLLVKMKDVGFYRLAFGVEAGNNRILKNIKKGETVEEIEQAIARACELGFQVKLTFLIGSPGETWEDIQDSIKFAQKYPVWKFNFFNLVPFPGTELYDWITDNGYWLIDPPEHLNEINHWSNTPAFETPELSREKRIQAYKVTHRLMDEHWGKRDRMHHRVLFKEQMEANGFPVWLAKILALVYHNEFMPIFDKRLPGFSHWLRSIVYKVVRTK